MTPFPDFRAARVVHEDADVIVVDKPPGVPCEAPDPEVRDDLPRRLALFLAARDGQGAPAYVGVHQRLDAATSGVVLYAKRREANASLAKQFEGRQVEKEYVAIASGRAFRGVRTLRHALVPGDDGTMVVARRGDRRAKEAETDVEVVAREGDRLRVRCRIATGRTHQIRAQLAAEGMPVCGDALYGGAPAPRLMLHASRLALRHPTTGAALDVSRDAPRSFDDFLARGMRDAWDDAALLDERLDAACEARWGLARATPGTDCYRLVHEDADGLPGLAVDVYATHLVAHLASDAAHASRDGIFDALARLGFGGVYAKLRPKQASTLVDARREDVAPSAPVRGVAAPPSLVVHEHGLPLCVRLGDGLATGLYLDARGHRRRLRASCDGLSVLNLFAYTCAFGAAAIAGGASRVVDVDASKDALARGDENERAAASLCARSSRVEHVADDVFDVLPRLASRGERFDVVIADPPTYATTRGSRWTSGDAWRGLVALCAAVLAPGGRLHATTNDRRMSGDKLRALIRRGGEDAGVRFDKLRDVPLPRDFRSVPWGVVQSKTVVAQRSS